MSCHFINLGRQPYPETYEIQKKIHRQRIDKLTDDVFILVEHSPTLTVGRNGGLENIVVSRAELDKQGIAIHEIERGGNITYHGPGQLVGYPILDLCARGKDLHKYVSELEEVIIRTLASYGVSSGRRSGYPGVWVGDEKIAALGISVKNWVTMHGFAFNISCDLKHFNFIVPCGLTNSKVTSLARILGHEPDFQQVTETLTAAYAAVFETELQQSSLDAVLD